MRGCDAIVVNIARSGERVVRKVRGAAAKKKSAKRMVTVVCKFASKASGGRRATIEVATKR